MLRSINKPIILMMLLFAVGCQQIDATDPSPDQGERKVKLIIVDSVPKLPKIPRKIAQPKVLIC